MITHIKLENFKNVSLFDTPLDKINVLIGANNSGKSSVLQGIHFSILSEVVRRNTQLNTVPQSSLLYQPSYDFTLLRHGTPYTNYSGNTSKLSLTGDVYSDGENADTFEITISKGRNHGNISVNCRPNNNLRQQVTSYANLYSVYVPGLSGIPLEEKLHTRAVIRRATANGDANLYLRNILYYIKENHDLEKLNQLLSRFFPDTALVLPYNPEHDINIVVNVRSNGRDLPIELSGTGFLQIVQILAYALLFSPKLLLLDEPDEHLHPNNQSLLVDALLVISDEMDTQIILCTHSRHMLSFLSDDAKVIWMKNGYVNPLDTLTTTYDVLVDIGALDIYDNVIEGRYNCVFLTEDKKVKMMKTLLSLNGYDMTETLIIPYKGCSNIEAALQLADFIHRNAPNCIVVIHRDRDFMTDTEVQLTERKITSINTIPFITDGSDIESYFTSAAHIANLLEIEEVAADEWLNELALSNHIEIQEKFSNKRNEIKFSFLYRDDRNSCPSTLDLLGQVIPLPIQNRLGKFMLRKVNGDMQAKYGRQTTLMQNSPSIIIEKLQEIRENLNRSR